MSKDSGSTHGLAPRRRRSRSRGPGRGPACDVGRHGDVVRGRAAEPPCVAPHRGRERRHPTGSADGRFRPGRGSVTRAGLASALHRGLPRLAVDDSVGDISADPVDLELVAASTSVSVASSPATKECAGRAQHAGGDRLTADGRLHTQSVRDQHAAELRRRPGQPPTSTPATRAPRCMRCSPTPSWPGPCSTYEVTADHDCGQALDVVQGALTGQTAAFTGNGQAFPD